MTPEPLRWLFCLLLVVPLGERAWAAEDVLAQRRAQAMTRELVETVLDGQLRQLEENGLAGDPLYAEIADIRNDLEQLVAGPMSNVVEQLVAAEQAIGETRQQQYTAAREEMRGIILELGVARQSISRRIQSVTWMEQVARLRERQQRIHHQTASLTELPPETRSDRAIGLLADQRDLEPLFTQFTRSLEDATSWNGQTALTASLIRQWLRDQPWATQWTLAEQQLAEAKYVEAADTQELLVAGLEELQSRLDTSQRGLSGNHGELRQQILALREQQQDLFEALSARQDTPPLELVEAQQQLAQQLEALSPRLIDDNDLGPLQQQATDAAQDATAALFLEDRQTGLAEQQRVLDRLDQLAQLLAGTEELFKDRSAVEIAAGIQQLERTQQEIAALQQSTEPAEELARHLENMATTLHQAPLVAVRLHSASEQMGRGDEPTGPLRQAAAAVAETLADWRRAELAVRIGEISRAAEALERAAAAERGLARAIRPLVDPSVDEAPIPPPDQNAKWRSLHADALATATATREGVGPTSPNATHAIEQALQAGRNLATTLAPDAPLPPDAADSAASDAITIANFLAEAAAELRGTIGQSAQNLVSLTEEQIASVSRAGQQLEAAAQATPPAESSLKSAADAASQVDYATTVALQASERARARDNSRDFESGLERAAIGLAARHKQLSEAHRLSQALGQLAKQQQSAVDAIDTARDQLESPAETEDTEREEQLRRQAAQSMRSATRQFAETQKETGEAASQISNQRELANDAIRQALEAAGRLPMPTPPPEPSAEELAKRQAAAEQAESAQSESEANAEKAMQAPDTKTASSGANQSEQSAGDAAHQSSNSQSAGQSATAADAHAAAQQVMGTELVSSAADETAQMMAGADANAAMSEMDAANPDGNTQGESGSSESDFPGDSNLNTEANSEQSSATGSSASSAAGPPAEGESQSNNRGQDASMPSGTTGDAAWWAKLPPEVRDAVRAGTSRPAPPGYEQRLKRYFESVDTD